MKIAYAFALVGDHLSGEHVTTHLTAIHIFMMTNPRFDVISLQTHNMRSDKRLQRSLELLNVTATFVDPIVSPRCKASDTFRFAFSYTILKIWNLTKYDKVLYFDGDLAVLKNFDNLVSRWAITGTTELRSPQGCNTRPTRTAYNTGVWGVTPSQPIFKRLYNWLHEADYSCGIGFQTAMIQFGVNHSFTSLPLQYNMKVDKGIASCMRRRRLAYVGVVHWSGDVKPINRTTKDAAEKKALKAYQTTYNKIKRNYMYKQCAAQISCQTGLGDTLFEIISAVAVQTLNGCEHTVVHTPRIHEHRVYNWSFIQSPLFTIVERPMDNAWIVPGGSCGIKALSWIEHHTNAHKDTIKRVLKTVARSVRVVNVANNVSRWDATIHLRRGDMMTLRSWSTRSMNTIYDKVASLLKSHGLSKNYVCSDDQLYGAKFAERIGATFVANSSPYYDLDQMLKSKFIVRAAPESIFSLLGAAISSAPLIRAYSQRGKANDQKWIDAGLVNVKSTLLN